MSMGYGGDNFLWENRNLRGLSSVIGQVVYKPGGSCGPRIQKNYQLFILHSGSCRYTCNKSNHELKADTVSLLTPGHKEYFSFSRKSETHHSWCTVPPSALPDWIKSQLKQHILNIPCSETFKRFLSGAFQLRQPLSKQGAKVVDLSAQSIFAEFLNMADNKPGRTKQSDGIAKAISYMENHFSEQDCLVKTHTASGVSRNTLIARFKSELKTTPDKFLWKIRTERGLEMLAETGLTIGEIAYKCGFKNPFHFSRMVRLHNGSSPRTIRQNAWTLK